ncbi:50S ribosomal protein L21 [Candidatus Karelsulcia muelleri]|uniref:50S ribosomal protein L21 n=1 Tax=Candidatus Karelsulcia muelleri TaxID=336810 RepID=UPI000D7CE5DF|nr:50S ribosomal protein L21 [Candidatus Karelsulcia muelleri]
MEAYFEILGFQFKATLNSFLTIPYLKKEKEGNEIIINNIIYLNEKGKILMGFPYINKIKLKAKIINHYKGKKLIIFKKKRRKGFKLKKGHRQLLTTIKIIGFEKNFEKWHIKKV